MRYWVVALVLLVPAPAYAIQGATVEPKGGFLSFDYQNFQVGADHGRAYNLFAEYGLDEATGVGISLYHLRSGSDRVTLTSAYAKLKMREHHGGRSQLAAYAGVQSRDLSTPTEKLSRTGFELGAVTSGSLNEGLRGLARLGADIYEDDTFIELELAAGLRISAAELQAGYRSITSLRAAGPSSVHGLFLGVSIPFARVPPLRW